MAICIPLQTFFAYKHIFIAARIFIQTSFTFVATVPFSCMHLNSFAFAGCLYYANNIWCGEPPKKNYNQHDEIQEIRYLNTKTPYTKVIALGKSRNIKTLFILKIYVYLYLFTHNLKTIYKKILYRIKKIIH